MLFQDRDDMRRRATQAAQDADEGVVDRPRLSRNDANSWSLSVAGALTPPEAAGSSPADLSDKGAARAAESKLTSIVLQRRRHAVRHRLSRNAAVTPQSLT